ncbi:MAG: Holliday junction branch migration protein RuvA [Alphaproteobacteria bacterium]
MIGKLTGILDQVHGAQALVDVQGVGYVVGCSARTLRQCPALGHPVSLLVETQVREDAITLYGFIDPVERDWFRLLITVQGVGAKVALAILSSLSSEQLAQAIATQDKALLTQADGVGPKLAVRLMTELKDKIGGFALPHHAAPVGTPGAVAGDRIGADALSALLNLGYRRAEAFDALLQVRKEFPDAGLDALIPAALRCLSQHERAA